MTSLSVTPLSRSFSGLTCTWICWSRLPHTEMFATPGTPIRRGRTVQRASTDFWIGVRFAEDRPIIITRLDVDSGCSIVGGLETFGKAAPPSWVRRSCTGWRPL